MYTYMYIYVYIYVYICMYLNMYLKCIYINEHIYVYIHNHIFVYLNNFYLPNNLSISIGEGDSSLDISKCSILVKSGFPFSRDL
jgi:hypothetical protein